MKRTSAELKRLAREVLRGHYGLPMGAFVVSMLIVTVILFPFSIILGLSYYNLVNFIIYYIVAILVSLIGFILMMGISYMHLNLARKKQPRFVDLFYAFTIRPDRFIVGYFILFLIGLVCIIPGLFFSIIGELSNSTLLLFLSMLLYLAAMVVGILITLRFTLVFLLLLDQPEMKVMQAFRESSRLMEGNKGRYFYIMLSFIGWSVLGALSCFIGYLWIMPYMTQTTVNFYLDIIGELDHTGNTADDMNPYNNTVSDTEAYSNTIQSLIKESDPVQEHDTLQDNTSTQDTLQDNNTEQNTLQSSNPIPDTPQDSYNNDSDLI